MMEFLFGSPMALIVTWIMAIALWFVVWQVTRAPRAWRGALVTVAVGVVLIVVGQVIVTPRERIETNCRQMGRYVETGDMDGLAACFAPSLRAGDLNRDQVLEAIGGRLRRYKPEEVRLSGFDVSFAGDGEAVVTFGARCRIVSVDEVVPVFATRWRLTMRRDGPAWRVTRIELIPTPTAPFKNLAELIR